MCTTNSVLELLDRPLRAEANAVAVSTPASFLTYGQLQERSERWAASLQQRGVEQGARVGICVERSLDLAVAVLAVLRAGAAYVPLDPTLPVERLELMVSDSEVTTCIARRELRRRLPTTMTNVDPSELDDCSSRFRPCAAAGDAAAYVIFTSGSTGHPKGVVMPHRALANLIAWQSDQPGFSQPARVLQFTPLSFDVHFQEFMGTWTTGGELVLVQEELRRDPISLLRRIDEARVERLFLPPVALQQIVETALAVGPIPQGLRQVVTAGEQLVITPALRELFRRLPGCRLHNHYGPSETHVVTAHSLPADPMEWPDLPPIGRPIANCEALLVDDKLQPVPVGESGEIVLAGVCLASGYVNRPEDTLQRFVPHPLREGERMYRTGDIGRQATDGTLTFLGRNDGQVKIRGHRVETLEVENALLREEAVSACAVVAHGADSSERSLTAYVVPQIDPHTVAASAIADELGRWREVWDGTYADPVEVEDSRFDTTGWNSSYTGQALPASEMKRWVDGTVERILSLSPRRVLEVGCGTGLILFGVAPRCQHYLATDYSPEAVGRLERSLATMTDLGGRAQVRRLAADEFSELSGQSFDTVILNSVTQHFVSLEYLERVLRQACSVVPPGGHLFVGDVTSATTRELYLASVTYTKASDTEPVSDVRSDVERRMAEEHELVVDPRWFYLLPQLIPEIVDVEVQLKPDGYDNELGRFRYDVTLERGAPGDMPAAEPGSVRWIDWQQEDLDLSSLPHVLDENRAPVVGLSDVPNARVAEAAAVHRRLFDGAGEGSMRELRGESLPESAGLVPQAFWDLASSRGYRAQVLFSKRPDCMDVVLRRHGAPFLDPYGQSRRTRAGDLASRPYLTALFPGLVQGLKRSLAHSLPEYMIPVRFQMLRRLPLTASGKIDRLRLPAPSTRRPPLQQDYVAPSGDLETRVAGVWADTLGIDRVGVLDNFFDLGGNSILSLRALAAMNRELGLKESVVVLFQFPTVRGLADHVDNAGPQRSAAMRQAREGATRQRRAFSRVRRGVGTKAHG